MSDTRQHLPAVHQLLDDAEKAGLLEHASRAVTVESIRELIDESRQQGGTPPNTGWLPALQERITHATAPTLYPVINATGVVLHTNLGRAPLAKCAVDAIIRVAAYSTLEYDLESGARGSRRMHVRELLRKVTGAEDALVVTNAAAALVLALNTVAEGGETIVSRGELVEIGGAFRIPDILRKSGTVLVEVGSTNRTRIRDYVAALSPRTRCILKVHRSNFAITGFTSEVAPDELADLCHPRGVSFIHDCGSGLLLDLEQYGLRGEPLVQTSVQTGALVVFSGDKLVGGPQAGIIAGPAALVAKAAQNPFARAMRPDKIVLAALEATLNLYRDTTRAMAEVPVLSMLTAPPAQLKRRATELAARIDGATVEPGMSSPGGGSFPQ